VGLQDIFAQEGWALGVACGGRKLENGTSKCKNRKLGGHHRKEAPEGLTGRALEAGSVSEAVSTLTPVTQESLPASFSLVSGAAGQGPGWVVGSGEDIP
jgi:hypothetical protein